MRVHDRPSDPSLREIPPGGRTTGPQTLPERGIGARWFWTLQICGWGFYAGQKYLAAGLNLQTYIHFGLLIFLAWGLHLVYRRVFRVRRPLGVEVLIVVGSSLVSGFLLLVLGDIIYRQLGFITSPLAPNGLSQFLVDDLVISLTHFKSLTLLTWSAVYLVLVYGLDVERERQASLQARALSHQAQLEMLRNQLSPHFLFNALNSMSVLIREDPARAEQMLDELSEFLRYSLASTKVQEATLADEVDVIRRYLAIQQIRFEEKLTGHLGRGRARADVPGAGVPAASARRERREIRHADQHAAAAGRHPDRARGSRWAHRRRRIELRRVGFV